MAVVPHLFRNSESADAQISAPNTGSETSKNRVRIPVSGRRISRAARAFAPESSPAPSVTSARKLVPSPPPAQVYTNDLSQFLVMWQINGDFRNLSKTTRDNRAGVVNKLIAYLAENDRPVCSPIEIQTFIAFVRSGGTRDKVKKARPEPARPNTVASYFSVLRAFFTFLVKECLIGESPCAKLPAPRVPQDQVRPYTDAQVLAILEAAKQTGNPRRDFAMVSILAETGIRASELLGLRRCDVDLQQHHLLVMGKGGKMRTVGFGLQAKAALMRLFIETGAKDDDYIFVGSRCGDASQPLARSTLQHLVKQLGKNAGITGAVRISPHTFRHYAAVTYIANDADAHMVKTLLGHTSLKMTDRYVALGQAALDKKVKKHSPLDNLKRAGKK